MAPLPPAGPAAKTTHPLTTTAPPAAAHVQGDATSWIVLVATARTMLAFTIDAFRVSTDGTGPASSLASLCVVASPLLCSIASGCQELENNSSPPFQSR
jgi:hypothetical protein